MSIYNNFKKYNSFVKKNYINNDFISQQNILNNINKNIKSSKIAILKQNVEILLFRILNFISLKKSQNKKILKIHYWLPKNNKNNYIDERSSYFLSKNKTRNQINLVRGNSLIFSMYLFFVIPNVIFIKGFNRTISISDFNNLKSYKNIFNFYETNEKILSNNLSDFFVKKKIKELIAIDDYRIIQTLLRACKKAKVNSIGYQHGRFNNFQIGLKGQCFDKYIVWSEYFKKKLININNNYKNKIIKTVNFRFKKSQINHNKNNILYICEQNINYENIFSDIEKLLKNKKNKKLFVRLREKDIYPQNFINFLNFNKIEIVQEKSLLATILKHKIRFLIGYTSTALLEASLYNVYPLIIIRNNLHLKEYLKEKLVFKLDKAFNLHKLEKELLSSEGKKKLEKIKKKLWN